MENKRIVKIKIVTTDNFGEENEIFFREFYNARVDFKKEAVVSEHNKVTYVGEILVITDVII